jgi:hypothetical protein
MTKSSNAYVIDMLDLTRMSLVLLRLQVAPDESHVSKREDCTHKREGRSQPWRKLGKSLLVEVREDLGAEDLPEVDCKGEYFDCEKKSAYCQDN